MPLLVFYLGPIANVPLAPRRMFLGKSLDIRGSWVVSPKCCFFIVFIGKWDVPMSGKNTKRPPAVGGHVFTKFDSHRAVLFGGRTKDGRKDHTWIFDLDKKVWSVSLHMLFRLQATN